MARLLVMDDDAVFGFQLKQNLALAKHEVELCRTASLAIEELSSHTYDVLITDMIVRDEGHAVPDGGIKLIGWVRRTRAVRSLPIIAMTGVLKTFWMQDILKTAEQIGANTTLEKPFEIGALLKIIDSFTHSSS